MKSVKNENKNGNMFFLCLKCVDIIATSFYMLVFYKRQVLYETYMNIQLLQNKVEDFWNRRNNNDDFNKVEALKIANEVIELLDCGKIRVAEKQDANDKWVVNEWVKKAILLSFLNDNSVIPSFSGATWYDKCNNKFDCWTSDMFAEHGIRVVPGAFVRKGAFLARGSIVMPSFVNIGSYVDECTMIDSMSTIGSCCQIGKKCHISANVCIGGVLEPLQSSPVIIEDECFIGAGSVLTEGIVVGYGSVIASGVVLSSGIRVINRTTGEQFKGIIPPYSVVVAGSYMNNNGIGIKCAVIIKSINEDVRNKTAINDLLR